MSNTLLIKRSNAPGSVPSSANLALGEIALNYTDGNLFYKNNSGVVTVLASNQFVSVSGNITGNNVLATTIISAGGNVTGGNINTAGVVTATGNVSGGNISTGGIVSATGNITSAGNISASYFLGNGAFLTGLSVSTSEIANGTSNIRIATANGNATVAIAGLDNSQLFTKGSLFTAGPFSTPKTVNNQSLVTDDVNAFMFGNVTIGNTGNVYVPSTSTLQIGDTTVLSGNLSGNVNGNGYGLNSLAFVNSTTVSASGNITANYFLGDGSQLTNLPAGNYSNANVAAYLPTYTGNLGSMAGNLVTTANVSGGNIVTTGLITATGNVIGGNVSTAGLVSATGNVTGGNIVTSGALSVSGNANIAEVNLAGNIIPTANAAYDLGTNSLRFNDLYLAGNSIVLGDQTISANGTGVNLNSTMFGTGAVISGNITTTGIISATGNIIAGNIEANVVTSGPVSTTGNVTAGNVTTNRVEGTALTVASTGDISLLPTANINVNNRYVYNVPTPVSDTDAVNKLYVDNFVSGLNIHDAVKVGTPDTLANISSGTVTYNNGSAGVGATLTTTGTFNLIDTVNVQVAGTRILVLNEANAVTNGIYVWSNATVITRATDYNSVPEVEAGDFMFVSSGATYANTGWTQTSTIQAIGTAGNVITFTQFSGAGTYTAGTGLTLSGTQFSITNSGVSAATYGNAAAVPVIAMNLQGQITTANTTPIAIAGDQITSGTVGNAYLTGAYTGITGVGTLGSLSVTGNVSGGNVMTAGLITATGNVTGDWGNFSSVDAGNVEVTNIKARDGTAAASIADSTGVVSITSNPVLSGGTANGVLYLNGSKVATSGSALTFDGTNLVNLGGTVRAQVASTQDALQLQGRAGGTSSFITTLTPGTLTASNTLTLPIGTTTLAGLATAQTFSATQTFSAAVTMSGTTTNISIGTSQTTGTTTIGGTAQTGTLTFGRSTGAQTLDIGVGATTSGTTKTINLGTAGVSGSITNLNYGSAVSGATVTHTWSSGANSMTLNSSGNLGLGVTPSAWSVPAGKIIEVGTVGNSIWGVGASNMVVGSNIYYASSSYKYANTGSAASAYQQAGGVHYWYNAVSGTAGDTITFTQAMTLDASGNLSVGQDSSKTSSSVFWTANQSGRLYVGTENSSGGSIVNGTSAYSGVVATNSAYPLSFGTNNTERARITSGGDLLVGTTSGSNHVIYKATSSTILTVTSNTGADSIYINGVNSTGANLSQAAALYVQKDSGNSRSINAAGTVNASGADYAEYMVKAGDFTIAKGDVCGIDANGKLTNVFADAVSFVVKSTDPSYVGGDTWANEETLGAKPTDPDDLSIWQQKVEEARQKVDRIAFAGQVPVNVFGATPGQYIVPINDNNAIKGQAVSNPTFEQYQSAVGKVIALEADGRAKIIVKVA